MAHRPTDPRPYFECVDATKDIDISFRVANHDIITSAEVAVLYGISTVWTKKIQKGTTEVRVVEPVIYVPGETTYTLTERFDTIAGVYNVKVPDEYDHSIGYTYNKADNAITITVPASIEIDQYFYVEGFRNETCTFTVKGGNGDDSIVTLRIPAKKLSNGRDYKWKILKLNGESVDNREFFFSTKAEPTVSITAPTGDKIKSVSAEFIGSCDAEIEYYRWELRDEYGVLVYNTGDIYNSNLSCAYEEFFSGDTITANLYVKVKMYPSEFIASKTYNIAYEVYENIITTKVKNNEQKNRVEVDFTGLSYIGGRTSYKQYNLENGKLHIDAGEYIIWDEKDGSALNIPAGTGYSLKFLLDNEFFGTIMEINDAAGAFSFGYDGKFWHEVDGTKNYITSPTDDFASASMFQSTDYSAGDELFKFYMTDEVDFDDANTMIKIDDRTFSYWWFLSYENGSVTITKGDDTLGT